MTTVLSILVLPFVVIWAGVSAVAIPLLLVIALAMLIHRVWKALS